MAEEDPDKQRKMDVSVYKYISPLLSPPGIEIFFINIFVKFSFSRGKLPKSFYLFQLTPTGIPVSS